MLSMHVKAKHPENWIKPAVIGKRSEKEILK